MSMTPFKQHEHRSMSFTSCESSSVDNDDVPMDECACANAYASPPRSASCLDASSRRKELFGGANTPKTRLLFGEDLEDEVRRSPLPYNARRALKPLDPLDSNNLNDSSESASTLSSSSVQGRKRSSAERRGEHHHETPGCMKMGERDESSTGGVLPIYESPRISPNSFLTMDGRFVQSKNPFSSPMMTDTPTLQHQQQLMMGTTQAPSLPVSFYGNQLNETSADAKFSPGFLPPRHHHHALLQPKQGTPVTEATAGLHAFSLSGYPEHAHNGFTCSPIPEQGPVVPNNTRRPHTSNMMLMESTDTASAGSLHKVRRIHLSDDVVAATGHHLFNLAQRVTDHPEVDTSYMFMDQDNENNDGISPTDVLHFPSFPTPVVLKSGPPPTPVKQRPSKQPYSSNHRPPRTPGPPLLARKAGLRTPHHSLSSYMPGDESVTDTGLSNSRFYSDFDIIGELGHGSFGTVYKVLSRLDGCMYAIKAAQRQAKGVADRDRMLKEVYALAALSDQADTANFHIVRYHQAWMEDDRLYIQTELCSGTLGDEMARGFLTLPRCYKLLREILLALDFIHRHSMVHLDIKPENIFLKNDQYKLGDFGLVTKVSASQDVEEGDSRYMSMELLSGDYRSDLTKSDIFSLGATMYEICLGMPLPMNGQEWQDIRSGKLSPLPNADIDMANIIHRMMDPVAANRPTPISLLKHPLLLSDEQKALNVEKTKVIHANIQLAAQQQRMGFPPKRQLTRANTWSGSSLPYM